jgi:aryl-alcohol dehydrogenase-like predicted oxidoreductase
MQIRHLPSGLTVSAFGLGCWGMSHAYGPADESESIATIRAALTAGINHFDTADVYGGGHNESLLAKALAGRRQEVFLATKFGFVGDEHGHVGVDARPERVKTACEASLKRLATEVIDLYYLHRLDPQVAIEETVGAMAELVKEGKVRFLGLSEVSAATLRRAAAVHPIAALQSEYSLFTRDPEQTVLPTCRELGTALVAYSPLGRGLLTGALRSEEELAADDYRRGLPRFAPENLGRNQALVAALSTLAREKGATPAQLALAWLLAQGEEILPIPGMKRRSHLADNLGGLQVSLSPADLARLATLSGGVSGPRHNPHNLQFIDS